MPISLRGVCLLLLGCCAYGLVSSARAENAQPHYTMLDSLLLPGLTRWDYLTFDATDHRLFITRGDSVDVLDINNKKIIGTIPDLDGVHGVAVAADLGKGFITEGKANRVTVF